MILKESCSRDFLFGALAYDPLHKIFNVFPRAAPQNLPFMVEYSLSLKTIISDS